MKIFQQYGEIPLMFSESSIDALKLKAEISFVRTKEYGVNIKQMTSEDVLLTHVQKSMTKYI